MAVARDPRLRQPLTIPSSASSSSSTASSTSSGSSSPSFSTTIGAPQARDAAAVDPNPTDAFLQQWIPKVEATAAYKKDGMIIILSDEAPASGPGAESSACCGKLSYVNTTNPGGTAKPGPPESDRARVHNSPNRPGGVGSGVKVSLSVHFTPEAGSGSGFGEVFSPGGFPPLWRGCPGGCPARSCQRLTPPRSHQRVSPRRSAPPRRRPRRSRAPESGALARAAPRARAAR